MKSTRLLAFVLAGSVVAPQLIWAQEPAPPPPPAATVSVQQPGPVDALAQRVREAQDPSSAIKAYADAYAAAPTDLEVQRAYVHRMAEFGLPEMADQQAQELLTHKPDDAVAWAVTGYVAAKRDQMDAAATDLVSAAQLAPDDPFVQRTGAQIVAWADSRKDKADLSPQTLAAIGTIRSKLSGKPSFAQAYQDALSAYQRVAMAPATTQPAPTNPSGPVTEAPGYDAMLGPSSYYPTPAVGTYAEPVYQAPYYYTPSYYAQPYWYPSGFYSSSWWWPTASSFIIVNGDFRDHFRHHHDHDFDDFRFHGRDTAFRDPHFFDHRDSFDRRSSFDQRGHFGDWTDPQRHFAMSPLDRGSRMTAFPQNDGRTVRSSDTGRSSSGIRISPSMAPNRVFSPAAPSPSPVPGRTFSPAVPSGRPIYGGDRVTRTEPRVVSPGMMVSPGSRGGWSGAPAMPPMRSGGSMESHAQPARGSMSPGEHWSGGGFSGHEMSRGGGDGGGRSGGGGWRR